MPQCLHLRLQHLTALLLRLQRCPGRASLQLTVLLQRLTALLLRLQRCPRRAGLQLHLAQAVTRLNQGAALFVLLGRAQRDLSHALPKIEGGESLAGRRHLQDHHGTREQRKGRERVDR